MKSELYLLPLVLVSFTQFSQASKPQGILDVVDGVTFTNTPQVNIVMSVNPAFGGLQAALGACAKSLEAAVKQLQPNAVILSVTECKPNSDQYYVSAQISFVTK